MVPVRRVAAVREAAAAVAVVGASRTGRCVRPIAREEEEVVVVVDVVERLDPVAAPAAHLSRSTSSTPRPRSRTVFSRPAMEAMAIMVETAERAALAARAASVESALMTRATEERAAPVARAVMVAQARGARVDSASESRPRDRRARP